ncbi:MAG: class I SAM-dependent rRNA methyltransferase [Defluviicoccus sp.]|nr:class I SAM-dependent rRNA methyltransferase [Defluviicoccus sp.]MDE0385974.1 class I SAM-dependent rRNA methyltransferase [Defluviicoccus sp.]
MATLAIDDIGDRPAIRLVPGRHKRMRAGHPWAFSNEIAMSREAKALPPGAVVRLEDSAGGPLGAAMFNPRPLISARILSRDPDAAVDRDFLAARLSRALALRERLYDTPYYRLAWSEADGLPGLVLDRYGDAAAAQINTAGMDRLAGALTEAIFEAIGLRSIVWRNDTAARGLEGLPSGTAQAGAPVDAPVEIAENGVRFLVDLGQGQKTGWFYDHRENRARVAALACDADVLDAYSYLGGFGLQAAAAGARSVLCLDRSEPALALGAEAARLNGLAGACAFQRGEVFATLEAFARDGRSFDVVVCDPPAFVKSKKDLATGLKGYRKLIRLAAACLRPGGFLFAASCSHHVDASQFAEAVRGALRGIGRSGRVLHRGGAGPDHPVHPFLPESAYLKSALLQLD